MTSRMPKVLPALFLPLLLGTQAFAAPATKTIRTLGDLTAAIAEQADGETWVIMGGNYGLNPTDIVAGGPSSPQKGWYFPITANNLTIVGQKSDDMEPVIYGASLTPNGSWASQDLIAVFGDNCSIKGLTLMPAYSDNKTVEVIGPINFSISHCTFIANTFVGAEVGFADGGCVYVSGNGATALGAKNKISISENTFVYGLVAFDGAVGKSLRVVDNTFDGIIPGGYAIGNTYWGGLPINTPFSDVSLGGNTFKNVGSTDPIIKARLTQTFNMDMDFTVDGVKVKQDQFKQYITFDPNARYAACTPQVKVGGTTYTRP